MRKSRTGKSRIKEGSKSQGYSSLSDQLALNLKIELSSKALVEDLKKASSVPNKAKSLRKTKICSLP